MAKDTFYEPKVTRKNRSIQIRGIDYCVNEWGERNAPLLVYLHGWADTGSTFQFVVDAFSRDWFVVAPDWRGFGRTASRAPAYWFPDYLADLHDLLKRYSANRAVHLVGHSMGANIASLYAGAMPERVQTLINVEGFGLNDSDPNDAPKRYREWIEAGQLEHTFSKYANFAALASRIKKRSPGMSAAQAEFVAREWAFLDDDKVVRLRADPMHKLPNAILYRRAEALACWKRIAAEILLVSGEKSPFREIFDTAATQAFPAGRTGMIKDAGHMIHFEAASDLAALIEDNVRIPL